MGFNVSQDGSKCQKKLLHTCYLKSRVLSEISSPEIILVELRKCAQENNLLNYFKKTTKNHFFAF